MKTGRKRGFVGNVGILTVGTLAGQALLVAASPALTRYYGPESMGAYGTYSTLLQLGLVVASLKYDGAVPLVKTRRGAFELGWICLTTSLLTFSGLFLVGRLWGGWISKFFGLDPGTHWLDLLALGIFCGGVFQVAGALCVKTNAYKDLASSRVGLGMGVVATQVGLGWAGWTQTGLLLGDAVGRVVAVGPVVRALWTPMRRALAAFRWSRIRSLLHEHRHYALMVLPASIMNVLAVQALLIWGPKYFSKAETGAFFIAYRTLYMPASLLAGSVSQVFLGRIAGAGAADSRETTGRVIISLLTLGAPVYLGVFLHAQTLFPWVFGKDWELSGAYASFMAAQVLIWMPATATSSLLLVGRRYGESILFTASHLLMTVGLLAWGANRGSFLDTALALTGLSVVMSILSIYRFGKVAQLDFAHVGRQLLRASGFVNFAFLLAQAAIARWNAWLAVAFWALLIGPVYYFSVRRLMVPKQVEAS